MKKKIKYTDEPPGGGPVGELVPIPDFLPPPDKLVFKKSSSTARKSRDFRKKKPAK